MCSSRKSPRKLRSGKSLDFSEEEEEDDRYRLIMNWNKSIEMSEYKNKTVKIINNKPMFKEDKNYLFWHPMHTFLKVSTSSSLKCAIGNCTIVSSHLAIFSPGSTCVTEPHWCCGCCCRDHCSHALIGGPSVVCIIVCRTGSVLYTFSSNQAGSAAVCTVTWGQKWSQSIYNNLLWDSSREMSKRMGPSIWISVTFQQFVLEQNSKHKCIMYGQEYSVL